MRVDAVGGEDQAVPGLEPHLEVVGDDARTRARLSRLRCGCERASSAVSWPLSRSAATTVWSWVT